MRAQNILFPIALALTLGCASRPTEPVATPATQTARTTESRLSADDWRSLQAGQRVERAMSFDRDGAHYVGGIAYQLVSSAPDVILHALLDPEQLRRMLPKTLRVLALGDAYPPTALEVSQGNDIVQATYSVVVEHDFDSRQLKFWLDPTRPSDIDDVWGYFRVTPVEGGKSLITVGAALDVGPGIVRLLFEEKIQKLILATPTRMRDVLESTPPAAARPALAQAR